MKKTFVIIWFLWSCPDGLGDKVFRGDLSLCSTSIIKDNEQRPNGSANMEMTLLTSFILAAHYNGKGGKNGTFNGTYLSSKIWTRLCAIPGNSFCSTEDTSEHHKPGISKVLVASYHALPCNVHNSGDQQ